MVWDNIEKSIKNRYILADGTVPSHIEYLLSSRYGAYVAFEKRRKSRHLNTQLKFLPFDYPKPFGTLIFYEEYYQNFKPNNQKLQSFYDGYQYDTRPHKTPITKRKNHLKARFAPLIDQAFNDFKNQYLRPPIDDDEMVEFLCTRLPVTAFDESELNLWSRMYHYAHKQGTYTAVKRSDRRTKHTESTYYKFAKWITINLADYSANDRYFITGFLADCKNNGSVVSRTKIDSMLRYDLSRDCFSEGDYAKLGLCTQVARDDFWDTMDIIKQAQKK